MLPNSACGVALSDLGREGRRVSLQRDGRNVVGLGLTGDGFFPIPETQSAKLILPIRSLRKAQDFIMRIVVGIPNGQPFSRNTPDDVVARPKLGCPACQGIDVPVHVNAGER